MRLMYGLYTMFSSFRDYGFLPTLFLTCRVWGFRLPALKFDLAALGSGGKRSCVSKGRNPNSETLKPYSLKT